MTVQVRQAAEGPGVQAWLTAILPRYGADDAALVTRAAEVADDSLGVRAFADGEAMAQHAREVAGILAQLPMDAHSVAAALLSPLPQADPDWQEPIRARFGPAVTDLVEGVHRMAHIQKLRDQVEESARAEERVGQLEALRKMLLAMVQDIRVVLIKLADQTQHLRYLAGRGDEAARAAAARDTLDVFAPLANRLGVWQLKWELEDLAFRCREPETYRRIARELDEKRSDREDFIARVTAELREALHAEGIQAEVSGRPKHIYSIYKKLQRKDLALKELYDVRGVRIMVEDTRDCYAALGLVHHLWTPLPKEFDDYIAKPKPNNYRSLHTAVVGPGERVLEVQIRTHEMHRQCELGVAAHWRYKEGARRDAGGRDARYDDKIAWLRQILDWREGLSDAGDLASRFRTQLFDDTIYVLTPQGRVVDLPRGATPVDFAYAVHTELGHRCRGARVDGAMVPLHHALDNGQTVEIVAAKSGGPSRDWLNADLGFVASHRARAKVRQWFNAQNHETAVAQGRQWVERELHRIGMPGLGLDALAQALDLPGVEALLLAAGRGDLAARAFDRAARDLRAPPKAPQPVVEQPATIPERPPAQQTGILVVGVDRLMTTLARCCRPLPPDPILGFVTRGRGVTVHRRDCPNVARMPVERTMEAQWGKSPEHGRFTADIEVQGAGDSATMRDVLDVLARERITLVSSSSSARGLMSHFTVTVEVPGGDGLQRLLMEIGRLPSVHTARRR